VAWATLDEARADWPDAPADDATLTRLLDDSTAQLIDYAPSVMLWDPDGVPLPVPLSYSRACTLQARALWNAARDEAGGDVIGFEQFAVRIPPVSLRVRHLLRPPRGVPGVG
jgi:hypothetical protein